MLLQRVKSRKKLMVITFYEKNNDHVHVDAGTFFKWIDLNGTLTLPVIGYCQTKVATNYIV